MKKSIYFRLTYFFSFTVSVISAQTVEIDSLKALLRSTKVDTTKVNCSNALFLQYEYDDDALATAYLKDAISLSQKIGYKKGLAMAYIYSGYFREDKGNYQGALSFYSGALKIAIEADRKDQISSSYNSIGSVYYYLGNYPEALNNYFLSLKMDEARESKTGVAYSYNNIGLVYERQQNYKEALKNYYASLILKKELGDEKGMIVTYNNIGNSYSGLMEFDKALENYHISLKGRIKLNDKFGEGDSYNNIGVVYYALAERESDPLEKKKLFDRASENYLRSLGFRASIGDTAGIASSCINLGNVDTYLNKLNEAESYYKKGKELSEKVGSKEYLKDLYEGLVDLDVAKGDYKSAFRDHKQYVFFKDSLDNEETRKKTVQSQMTYDFEKREAVATAEHKKELENQQLLSDVRSRKQRIVLFLVLGSLVLVIGFAGFIFRSLRITRRQKRIIELQKDLVEQQKQEVELQKNIVEEKQKEIIDSIRYAKQIQQSLLPSEKYIDKSLRNLTARNK